LARNLPRPLEGRKLVLRWIINPKGGQRLDRAFVWFHPGPSTYTGQDMAEIHGHGGVSGMERLLSAVQAAGARMASPGEFTFRAFMNGRMNLAEAEAVCEFIEARGSRALELAVTCLEGELGSNVERLQAETVDVLAELEAEVDFPEERLDLVDRETALRRLVALSDELERLAQSYDAHRVAREGGRVGIIGRTNVGKSSLLNRLLGRARAVVDAEAGTTRDYIEVESELEGLAVVLIDTVGIRPDSTPVETSAADLTEPALRTADVLLVLADAAEGLTDEDLSIWHSFEGHSRIAIWNKVDLKSPKRSMSAGPWKEGVEVSALTGAGLERLKAALLSGLTGSDRAEMETVVVTRFRHKEALDKAVDAVNRASASLKKTKLTELAAVDLKEAVSHLGHILGVDVEQSVLENIFSRFCIGK
jgi:tRNA modification GTPase